MNKSAPKFFASRHGSAAVEFALLLPLMSLLLFGFFEMGRLFYTYNVASSAARDAARFAARLPMTCGGLSSGDAVRVQNVAVSGDPRAASPAVLTGLTPGAVSLGYVCVPSSGTYSGIYEDAANVPTVTVTVTAPFTTLFATLLPGLNLTQVAASHAETWTE